MRFLSVIFLLGLFLMAAFSRAALLAEHKDPRAAVREMAAHYYSTREIAGQCGVLLPAQRDRFDAAWSAWQQRNAASWALVGRVRDQRMGKRDREELQQLADTMKAQYATAPFDASMCNTALKMLQSTAWDYSVKFPSQLNLLKAEDAKLHQ